jgi:hypothetical protein
MSHCTCRQGLLNPPTHSHLTSIWRLALFRTWLVVTTARTKAVSPTCAPDFRFIGSAESGSKHYEGTLPCFTFVILLPLFAANFPSASCTFTSISLGETCLLFGWVILFYVHAWFLACSDAVVHVIVMINVYLFWKLCIPLLLACSGVHTRIKLIVLGLASNQ